MSLDFRRSVVRIDVDGKPQGTGFVAGIGLIVTCAHVVADANGQPCKKIRIVFHHDGEQCDASVLPSLWRPPEKEDIAFLAYSGELPLGISPVSWGHDVGAAGDACVTFGYPDVDLVDGLWAHAVVSGPVSGSDGLCLLQIRSSEITKGFSGAPLFNQRTRLVIGMVSAITIPDECERLKETAFIAPSDVLLSMCPALRPQTIATINVGASDASHRRQIELEGAKKKWDLAFEKLSCLERALILENRVDERMRLEHEAVAARKSVQSIEDELKRLEAAVAKPDFTPPLRAALEEQWRICAREQLAIQTTHKLLTVRRLAPAYIQKVFAAQTEKIFGWLRNQAEKQFLDPQRSPEITKPVDEDRTTIAARALAVTVGATTVDVRHYLLAILDDRQSRTVEEIRKKIDVLKPDGFVSLRRVAESASIDNGIGTNVSSLHLEGND
ncbi:MAG TPA: serine protease [Gemmataceae bacterium]|nr:serine protease [Gemmataceae bacterium]